MSGKEFNCRADVANSIVPMLHLTSVILTIKPESRAALFKMIYNYCIKPNSENANESIDPELKELIEYIAKSHVKVGLSPGKFWEY